MQLQGRILTGISVLLAFTASSVVAEGEQNNLRVAAVHITSLIARAPDNIFARQLGACPEATQTPCDDGNGCCQSGVACTTSRGIPVCNVACNGSKCAFGGCCPVGYRCFAEQTACIKIPQEPNPSLPTVGPAPTPSEIDSEITGVFTPTPPSFPKPSTSAVPTTSSSLRDTGTAGDGGNFPETPEPTAPTDPLPPDSPNTTVPAQSDVPGAASAAMPLPGLVQLFLSGLGLILGGLY